MKIFGYKVDWRLILWIVIAILIGHLVRGQMDGFIVNKVKYESTKAGLRLCQVEGNDIDICGKQWLLEMKQGIVGTPPDSAVSVATPKKTPKTVGELEQLFQDNTYTHNTDCAEKELGNDNTPEYFDLMAGNCKTAYIQFRQKSDGPPDRVRANSLGTETDNQTLDCFSDAGKKGKKTPCSEKWATPDKLCTTLSAGGQCNKKLSDLDALGYYIGMNVNDRDKDQIWEQCPESCQKMCPDGHFSCQRGYEPQ